MLRSAIHLLLALNMRSGGVFVATAGTLPLHEEDGTVMANLFFVAHMLDGDLGNFYETATP